MDALRCPPPDADVKVLSGGERRRRGCPEIEADLVGEVSFVDRVFPLDDTDAALRHMEAGAQFGKAPQQDQRIFRVGSQELAHARAIRLLQRVPCVILCFAHGLGSSALIYEQER